MVSFTVLLIHTFVTLVLGKEFFLDPLNPTVVLASFGSAEAIISVHYEEPDADMEFSRNTEGFPKMSVGAITSSPSANGLTNYSFPLTFSSTGVLYYTVSTGERSISSHLIVAGFDIIDGEEILSGDDGEGVIVGLFGKTRYNVQTVGIDGKNVSLSLTNTTISFVSEGFGIHGNMDELDLTRTHITSEQFVLALNDFRIGLGKFVVNFQTDDIQYQGESFETTRKVQQQTNISPPCVAVTTDFSVNENLLTVPMFNILSPPREKPAAVLVHDFNGISSVLDSERSSLVLPNQTAVFDISGLQGVLFFTCDGAEVLLRGVSIVRPNTTLATELIQEQPIFDYLYEICAKIIFVRSNPDELTAQDAYLVLWEYCEIIHGYSCIIESVESGSAAVSMCAKAVAEDGPNSLVEKLKGVFDRCEIQARLGYDCSKLLLEMVSVFTPSVRDGDDNESDNGSDVGSDKGSDEESQSSGPSPKPSESESISATQSASPTPSTSATPAPCIGASHLRHLREDSLVYPKHWMARVLCDMNGSCATGGHMVVFQGVAMMMRTYCGRMGRSEKVMLVNSMKSGQVESETGGLVFTKFAARYWTRFEELVMKGVIRMGL